MTDTTGGGLWRKLEQARLDVQAAASHGPDSPTGQPESLGGPEMAAPAPPPANHEATEGGQGFARETLLNGTVVVTNNTLQPPPRRDHEHSPPSKRIRRANPADYQRVGRSLF